MSTDWKALCAELLAEIDAKAWGIRSLPSSDAIDRARAALAQPEPEWVTDEEWDAIKDRLWRHYETTGYQGERFIYQGDFDTALDVARQELARFARPAIEPEGVTARELQWPPSVAQGCHEAAAEAEPGSPMQQLLVAAGDLLENYARPAIKPVPVAEQLPGPEDCCGNPRNGRGRWCWGRVLPQTDAGTPVVWRLMLVECLIDEATHWLPHHALPLPTP